ncbi:ferritin-like domain-containing protein [Caldicoprobacter algeriensis]|uniref:ferritin-like domain-containing protein n=1 Tax=Caldicoprobacter algeriensis TaxID=699281 RepID=UPI00207AB02D|nr:ferritin-like domain-containing protein [Caldicoprobacter algeriensis]
MNKMCSYNGANYHEDYNYYDDYYNDYYNDYYHSYGNHGRYDYMDNELCGCWDPYSPEMDRYCYPVSPGLIRSLEEYIKDELTDSRYYELLAQKAPTQRAKDLFMEFSKDEKMHAQDFMNAYFMLTGRRYQPPKIEDPKVPDDFMEALQQRILAETNDYKKYGERYLKAHTAYLRDLFFMTRTSEAQHAMRIPYLMHEHHRQTMR